MAPTDRTVTVVGKVVKAGIHCSAEFCQPDCCSGCRGLLALSDAATATTVSIDATGHDGASWRCVGMNAARLTCPAALGERVVASGRFVAPSPGGYSVPRFQPASACILSHPADIAAVPGSPFRVPLRLRLGRADHGPVVTYNDEDTVTVELDVTPGALVGARIRRDNGSESLGGVRPLAAPDDPNPVDELLDWQGGDIDRTYTLELFETTAPIVSHWTPELSGYRVLWQHVLRGHFRAAELEALAKPPLAPPP